jgi:hypothetical protein
MLAMLIKRLNKGSIDEAIRISPRMIATIIILAAVNACAVIDQKSRRSLARNELSS